jgi:hypothetical protein
MKTISLRTADEIRAVVDTGRPVYCGNMGYIVLKDTIPQYLIHHIGTNYYIGLTHTDGQTLNSRNFFTLAP